MTDPAIDPQGSGTQDDRASASAESAGPLNQIGLLQQFSTATLTAIFI